MALRNTNMDKNATANNQNQSSTADICSALGLCCEALVQCCGTVAAENERQEGDRQHLLGNHHEAEKHYQQAAQTYHTIGNHEQEHRLQHQADDEHNEHQPSGCTII